MLEIDSVITNGYVDIDTLESRAKEGWKFVVTVPAITAHPYAVPTDKLTIFSRYKEDKINEEDKASIIPCDK